MHLPRLQELEYDVCEPYGACLWLSQQPADMGSLSSSLLRLKCCGVGVTQFPLALTQLVALEHLNASGNEFAGVPAAITALSRLTGLVLGRTFCEDVLQEGERRPLDVRTLGDLSGFPALRMLMFDYCEVMLCESMLGAVRHASIVRIAFHVSHPAPECAAMVLQLSQALRRIGRGGVLSFAGCGFGGSHAEHVLQSAHALPPLHKFLVALQAYGM